MMTRFRAIALATLLTLTLTVAVQQANAGWGGPAKGSPGTDHAIVPSAEGQLKFLAEKLDLNSEQQEKMKPILQELHDTTMKLVQDHSMPHQEYVSKLRDARYGADKKIRAILTDEQKNKLDQVEQEPHPELHGNVTDAKN
jgi:Spy/CpxP family protein refolding chaperone